MTLAIGLRLWLRMTCRLATWEAAPTTASFNNIWACLPRDITSSGPYGVYHSVFDNFAWFKKFGDPDFVYEQEMARIFGLEALRMADAYVLPYDYEEYGKEVVAYVDAAEKRAENKFGDRAIDFSGVKGAAKHFQDAGARILAKQKNSPRDVTRLNQALLELSDRCWCPKACRTGLGFGTPSSRPASTQGTRR